MATTPILSQIQHEREEPAPKADWAMYIAAGALALVIGLSAADVQRDRSVDRHQTQNAGQNDSTLDGRGKWAGYMQQPVRSGQ